jgi:hypothetical protein
MGTATGLPTENDGWYKLHIMETLNALKEGHKEVLDNQKTMHAENVRRMEAIQNTIATHEQDDLKKFSSLNQEIADLQPVKKLVYAAITLVLMAFMGALIALVIVKH